MNGTNDVAATKPVRTRVRVSAGELVFAVAGRCRHPPLGLLNRHPQRARGPRGMTTASRWVTRSVSVGIGCTGSPAWRVGPCRECDPSATGSPVDRRLSCPRSNFSATSNVCRGSNFALEEYPLRDLWNAGIPITLNIDDSQMFVQRPNIDEYTSWRCVLSSPLGGADSDITHAVKFALIGDTELLILEREFMRNSEGAAFISQRVKLQTV